MVQAQGAERKIAKVTIPLPALVCNETPRTSAHTATHLTSIAARFFQLHGIRELPLPHRWNTGDCLKRDWSPLGLRAFAPMHITKPRHTIFN